MKRYLTGCDFGKMLVDAGIIPEDSGDVIIEVPLAGVVTIHTRLFATENLMAVVKAAAAEGARVVETQAEADAPRLVHGMNCQKSAHEIKGLHHLESEDGPFTHDGVTYCGRCHQELSR